MKNNFYTLNGDFIKEGHVGSSTRDFTGFTQTESGDKTWYKDGFRHRLDGPACEYPNRYNSWWFEGILHRLDGPAIEHADGGKEWFVNGECHRIYGPAYETGDGGKAWYIKGKRHRLDGPGYEHADGTKYWYIDDEPVTEEQHSLLVNIMKLKGLL